MTSGVTGATFLKIIPGARPNALGESACVATPDDDAILNTAGEKEDLVTATGNSQFDGLVNQQNLGINFSKHYSLNIIRVGVPDIEKTDDSGNSEGSFDAQNLAVILAYGWKPNDKLSLGFAGKFIQESIENESTSGVALDAGALYKYNSNWTFGATLNNLGCESAFIKETSPLPLNLKLAAAYNQDKLTLAAGIVIDPYNPKLNLGGEYQLVDILFLRAGVATSSSGINLSGGFGIKKNDYQVDYAFTPNELGNTHRLTVGYRF